jgi:hypothetical protein
LERFVGNVRAHGSDVDVRAAVSDHRAVAIAVARPVSRDERLESGILSRARAGFALGSSLADVPPIRLKPSWGRAAHLRRAPAEDGRHDDRRDPEFPHARVECNARASLVPLIRAHKLRGNLRLGVARPPASGSRRTGVYRRDFAKGTVLVNPTDAPVRVNFVSAMQRVVPVGGGTVDDTATEPGSLTKTSVTSLQVAARGAEVLLK